MSSYKQLWQTAAAEAVTDSSVQVLCGTGASEQLRHPAATPHRPQPPTCMQTKRLVRPHKQSVQLHATKDAIIKVIQQVRTSAQFFWHMASPLELTGIMALRFCCE